MGRASKRKKIRHQVTTAERGHVFGRITPEFEAKAARMTENAVPVYQLASIMFSTGHTMPVIGLNTMRHPDVRDWLRVQQLETDGEVFVQWGMVARKKVTENTMSLMADVQHPTPTSFTVLFDMQRDGTKHWLNLVEVCRVICFFDGRIIDTDPKRIELTSTAIAVPSPLEAYDEYIDLIKREVGKQHRAN